MYYTLNYSFVEKCTCIKLIIHSDSKLNYWYFEFFVELNCLLELLCHRLIFPVS